MVDASAHPCPDPIFCISLSSSPTSLSPLHPGTLPSLPILPPTQPRMSPCVHPRAPPKLILTRFSQGEMGDNEGSAAAPRGARQPKASKDGAKRQKAKAKDKGNKVKTEGGKDRKEPERKLKYGTPVIPPPTVPYAAQMGRSDAGCMFTGDCA